jgi:hypothetical protein
MNIREFKKVISDVEYEIDSSADYENLVVNVDID